MNNISKTIDKVLEKHSIESTTYLAIVNFREEEERFFRKKTHYRPRFKYPPFDFSLKSTIEELKKRLSTMKTNFQELSDRFIRINSTS